MEYGELITLYRKEAGLTIDELAEKSGVPKGTINKIIGGVTKAPTLPNMKALARAMGKTLADFDDPTPETKKSPSGMDREDKSLLDLYHQLNPKGRSKVVEYTTDLVNGGLYQDGAIEKQA